jgi:hypothetical protein
MHVSILQKSDRRFEMLYFLFNTIHGHWQRYWQACPSPVLIEALARRGGRFLRIPKRWLLLSRGGLQPRFFRSPSTRPSFAEANPVLSGEFFPAGIPHPSPSPPGNYNEKKLGMGKCWQGFWVKKEEKGYCPNLNFVIGSSNDE